MSRPIAAIISTANMRRNLQLVREHYRAQLQLAGLPAESVSLCAVVKANAYGHSLKAAVQAFPEADMLATIEPESLSQLRELGWQKQLLLLEGCFHEDDLAEVMKARAATVVHHAPQILMIRQAASALFNPEHPLDVFLKLNSGMNRLGFSAADFPEAYRQLAALQAEGRVGSIHFISHFANAEREEHFIDEPLRLIDSMIAGLPGALSLCNSAACLRHSARLSAYAARQQRHVILRPGICLYGASPMSPEPAQGTPELPLLPAMNLRAQIIAIQQLNKGDRVGYGSTYQARGSERLAVLACGYADGYPRSVCNGAPAALCGQIAPVAGRVSMDMMTIDVTRIPQAKIGMWVDLWGGEGPSIDDIARACGRTSYELMSRIHMRVPRIIEH